LHETSNTQALRPERTIPRANGKHVPLLKPRRRRGHSGNFEGTRENEYGNWQREGRELFWPSLKTIPHREIQINKLLICKQNRRENDCQPNHQRREKRHIATSPKIAGILKSLY
jgi:hypothetical protein